MRAVLGCLLLFCLMSCSSTPSYSKIADMYREMFGNNALYDIADIRITDGTRKDDVTYVVEATVREKMKVGSEQVFRPDFNAFPPEARQAFREADLGTKLAFVLETVGSAVAVMATYGYAFQAGDVFTRNMKITLTKKDSGWKITGIE